MAEETTARDGSGPGRPYRDLMTALAVRCPDQSAAEDDRIVRAALAEHAHELAERQRAWAEAKFKASPPGLDHSGYRAAMEAADLIDPQVPAGRSLCRCGHGFGEHYAGAKRFCIYRACTCDQYRAGACGAWESG